MVPHSLLLLHVNNLKDVGNRWKQRSLEKTSPALLCYCPSLKKVHKIQNSSTQSESEKLSTSLTKASMKPRNRSRFPVQIRDTKNYLTDLANGPLGPPSTVGLALLLRKKSTRKWIPPEDSQWNLLPFLSQTLKIRSLLMDSKQKWIASPGFSVSRKDTFTTLIKYICYRLTRLLSFVTGIIAMTFMRQVQERYRVFLPLHMQSVKFILTISKGDGGQEKDRNFSWCVDWLLHLNSFSWLLSAVNLTISEIN